MPQSLKTKLESIRALVDECLAELGSETTVKTRPVKPTLAESADTSSDTILQIVNKVGDCDEADVIEKHVLNARGPQGRVLLVFYIAYKYFNNVWLTSGDIEKVTSGLGVKINKKNVSNYLVEYRKYLEGKTVRKYGQPTPYRMNRSGAKRFEEIISGKGE